MSDKARHLVAFFVLLLALPALAQDFAARRADLVDEIRRYAALSGDESFGDDVLLSLNTIERHKFIPVDQIPFAYENRPLRIGYGQTISQPYIVALMTELLDTKPDDVVLEVGTGSGYQAAILSPLVNRVYTIEIVEGLAEQAGERLQRLGYDNVTTRLGDGYFGWEEHAPYDAIIVTAAPTHVPPPLVEQLKPGGRMVIPVGGRFTTQWLLLIEKNDDGGVVTRQIAPVIFVPLTGKR
ncbi:MAG: protein-L-isoaspartate(D-aspartate) O-methyltransferase [Woeseiaceae bacterium]|nr:protein-L-isoaspartate(D-aspartate) O-methyltransferase [Woeseiaceae bacterium]